MYLRLLLLFCLLSAADARANVVVVIQSVLGPIELELFDAAAPQTVANFLAYVDADAYDQSIIHRSVPGFVIQGGGYKLNASSQIVAVAVNPPQVLNEP